MNKRDVRKHLDNHFGLIVEQLTQEVLQTKAKVFVDFNEADKSKWSQNSQVISNASQKGNPKLVGIASPVTHNVDGDMHLFELNSFDKEILREAGVRTKSNEVIVRYGTPQTARMDILPFVKINVAKGLVYFGVYSESETADEIKFETRGTKFRWARFMDSFLKRHGIRVV